MLVIDRRCLYASLFHNCPIVGVVTVSCCTLSSTYCNLLLFCFPHAVLLCLNEDLFCTAWGHWGLIFLGHHVVVFPVISCRHIYQSCYVTRFCHESVARYDESCTESSSRPWAFIKSLSRPWAIIKSLSRLREFIESLIRPWEFIESQQPRLRLQVNVSLCSAVCQSLICSDISVIGSLKHFFLSSCSSPSTPPTLYSRQRHGLSIQS